ncbi:MAG: carboxypeptidase-like regulatory domain-containing protein [Candidatus Aminicenantes bacterium]|nr:carboxypeptidase-like regulatory domain-containing protein [Candidatus Aminicenantes bacterium]
MNKCALFFLILSIIFLSLCKVDPSDEDQTGIVRGMVYITDESSVTVKSSTVTPIEGATVSVLNTELAAHTDASGYYILENVPAGRQTLKVYAPGYLTETCDVDIKSETETLLDFCLSPQTGGSTFYVSTAGDDSFPGTETNPWKTPSYGSQRLQPGDTLIIKGGTYILDNYEDRLTPSSGTENAWITIKGEKGEKPRLEGSGNLFASVDISGSSYIRIENIEICAAAGEILRDGITGTGGNVKGVLLKDLTIHHLNEFGVDMGDIQDMQIIECSITFCGFGSIGGPQGENGGWRHVLIHGCDLSYSGYHYTGGNNPYERPDGFGIEPSSGPITIYDCTAEHNKGDGLDSKAQNTYIHHCIVANNRCDGIKLWGGGSKIENTLIYGTGDGDASSSPWAGIVIGTDEDNAVFEIINVTLHENVQRHGYPIYVQYDESAPISVVLRNTIIAGGYGHAYFGDSVELTAEYNIFYMPTRSDQVYANGREYSKDELGLLGPYNIHADPEFIQPAWGSAGNYTLQVTSPAVDTGTSVGAPDDDLAHTPRPQGAGYDRGAYER